MVFTYVPELTASSSSTTLEYEAVIGVLSLVILASGAIP